MKKIFLSMATLLAVGALSAQESETQSEGFKKGDAFVTGNVSFNSQKEEAYKTNSFTISPTVGYFATDNIALGVSLAYSGQKMNYNAFPDITNSSYSAGVFGRYYFTPANKFSFFGELAANYAHNKSKTEGGTDRTGNGFGVMAGPGFNYFVSSRFSLQTYVGVLSYGSSKTKTDLGDNKTTGFNASVNLGSVAFGVVYKL